MPTGYTASLEAKGYDVKRWIKEDVSRAFGMCIMMRDSGGELTEANIKKNLEKEIKENYHIRQLVELDQKSKRYSQRSLLYWKKIAKKQYDNAKREYDKKTKEYEIKEKAWNDARNKLTILLNKSKFEANTNVIQFAIDQWELVKDEYDGSYLDSVPSLDTPEQLKHTSILRLNKDIEYHTKEAKESQNREKERLQSYNDLVSFIDNSDIEKG